MEVESFLWVPGDFATGVDEICIFEDLVLELLWQVQESTRTSVVPLLVLLRCGPDSAAKGHNLSPDKCCSLPGLGDSFAKAAQPPSSLSPDLRHHRPRTDSAALVGYARQYMQSHRTIQTAATDTPVMINQEVCHDYHSNKL